MMEPPKKRAKIEDFKDAINYIHSDKAMTSECRANSSNLWN